MKWPKRLLIALTFPAFVYLVVIAFLFFGQTGLIFPVGQVGASGPLPAGAERLELGAGSGERLAGLHIPPARRSRTRTLILGFGGNAANADRTAAMLHDLYPDADVVVFHYRGYPPSAGRPGAAALQADALRIHDAMRARLRPARTIAVGFSVGGGVAAYLAGHRPLDGLILVTPFDSLSKVSAGHYPWAPVRLLFRNNMEPTEDLRGIETPVAIIAGGRDDLVVPARTQALRLAIPNLAFDRTIVDAGHNDIYDDPAFTGAMREAMESIVRRR
ncbi:MAG TPA: alpha/beta hydrolase [Allosphingosinicella sp.]